jgi:hypothetical protein
MKKRTKRVFVSEPTPPRIDVAFLLRTKLDAPKAISLEAQSQGKTERGVRRSIRKLVASHPALSRYL